MSKLPIVLVSLALALGPRASAQEPTGALFGLVLDPEACVWRRNGRWRARRSGWR